MLQRQRSVPPAPRYWPLDFIAALALAVATFLITRLVLRSLGFAPALLVLVFGGGLAWFYFRVAWNALMHGRANRR